MANRLLNQFQGTLEKGVVVLYGFFTMGGGTANATKVFGKGFSSLTYHSATGAYLLTLEDTYQKILGATFTWSHDDAKPAAYFVNIKSSEVSTSKTIHLEFSQTADGSTATAPADGDQLYITLHLSNSSAY